MYKTDHKEEESELKEAVTVCISLLSLCPEPNVSEMSVYLLAGSCENEEEW